jgi:hypothetical protein
MFPGNIMINLTGETLHYPIVVSGFQTEIHLGLEAKNAILFPANSPC